jgi:tRNA G18 (ribose-2'-O)-methylase SpoU
MLVTNALMTSHYRGKIQQMERVLSLDDPRIARYRNLPDRTWRGESMFIAEGRLLAARLLASRYEVESVLVEDEFVEEFRVLTPSSTPLYVVEKSLLLKIVGFNFHRGALAAGLRGQPLALDDLLKSTTGRARVRFVVCPEITKPENMGLVFRSAAAFGFDGVLLGGRCCDPFSRRAMRVSMGAVLQLPFVKTPNLPAALERLTDEGFKLYAAVLDPSAVPLSDVVWSARLGVLIGNEMAGLDAQSLARSHTRVTIPISSAVDSLNLGVAAGIFLHATERQK